MKLAITKLPDNIIDNVNLDNWEELFDDLIVNEYDSKGKIIERHYVWKPEVMKDFIKQLLKSTHNKH